MNSFSEVQMELPFGGIAVMVDPNAAALQTQEPGKKPQRSGTRRRKAEQLPLPFSVPDAELRCAHKGCKSEVEYGAHGIRNHEVYDEYWCDSHYRERHRRQHADEDSRKHS